tara:strand:- start:496 stop:1899 length:1404 start_codon:yes stop_codon:yes gene_type:complete
MRKLSLPGVLISLSLAACSGGSSTSNASAAPNALAEVLVVVETRAGSDALVQFQLAGATLEGPAGQQTDNLLPASTVLTVGDPTGEPFGLRLNPTPSGNYIALHLILVPDSGIVISPDGTSQSVTSPIDVRIPISEGLQHDQQSASWLVVGHDSAPLSSVLLGGQPGSLIWTPTMTGRLDGANVQLGELRFPVSNQNAIAATAATIGDATIELGTSPACIFEDETATPYASQAAFVAALSIDDDLVATGDLHRNGRIEATRIRRSSGSNEVRLIGTILSIDAATSSFTMQVMATRQNGNQVQLATPETAIIRAANAIIELSSSTQASFATLMAGQSVKVKWLSKSLSQSPSNGTPQYIAREVELLSGSNTAIHPEWEARVQSVDLANQVIVVVPRNNDLILINGVSVNQAEVLVSNTTMIERRENQGGSNSSITLAQIQPGTDRIWIRGTVVGSALISATRVRVRED